MFDSLEDLFKVTFGCSGFLLAYSGLITKTNSQEQNNAKSFSFDFLREIFFLKGEERILFLFYCLRENTISWIRFFFRFVTDVRSFLIGIGLAFRALDWVDFFFFELTQSISSCFFFESRDDDEVAYLVYVVRNDEVG